MMLAWLPVLWVIVFGTFLLVCAHYIVVVCPRKEAEQRAKEKSEKDRRIILLD